MHRHVIQHIHLITNPKGGVGDNLALAEQARKFFFSHGVSCEVHSTAAPGDATQWSAEIPQKPQTLICAMGGDGTMHEVINGMMQREATLRMPVALIPGGTGNSFMEDLGLIHPRSAMESILGGSPQPIDLMECALDGAIEYAFNVCGWGMMASGNQRAESMRWMGRSRYHAAGLLEIIHCRSNHAQLEVDGKDLSAEYHLIAASNSRVVGKGMLMSPHAKHDDGLMDLLMLKKKGRRTLMRLFKGLANGTHIQDPSVEYQQIREFRVRTPQSNCWNIDGEVRRANEMSVSIRSALLKWWLPEKR
tara:strand:- start:1994 stop:2908 length:915 start_codon:yes stop_codon:yes gene_type:complete